MCQETEDLFNKISSLRSDLQLNSYVQGSIDFVISTKGRSCPNQDEKPLGSVYIAHVKVVAVKFRCIGNR
jgi:hypothetical protein